MHNIILHAPETMELEIFKEIEKNKKAKVKIITYWENKQLTIIKKIFPNVKIINYYNLIWQGLEGNFANINHKHFSPEIKKKLYKIEDMFYHMVDRFDHFKNITFNERYNLYKFLICFWIENIKKNNINFFYSRSAPHECVDYILFNLIKSLFLMQAFNTMCYFPVDDYRSPWKLLKKNINNQNKENLKIIKNSYINEYLQQIKENYKETSGKLVTHVFLENFKEDSFLKLKKK